MLLKFLARIAMNGAPTLSNIVPLRSESFLFFRNPSEVLKKQMP